MSTGRLMFEEHLEQVQHLDVCLSFKIYLEQI